MGKEDLKINIATQTDAAKLREYWILLTNENPMVYGETSDEASNKEVDHYKKWISEYQQPDSGFFLLFKGEDIIGSCTIKRFDLEDESIGYYGSGGVLKKYQGKGYFKMLVNEREKFRKKNTKFKKVRSIIQKSNTNVITGAKKAGFRIIGEDEYRGIPEYILEKNL